MSTAPPTREFTISLPENLAQKVDQLAQQESRNTSELFREAFRTYFARQLHARMKQPSKSLLQASQNTKNPKPGDCFGKPAGNEDR